MMIVGISRKLAPTSSPIRQHAPFVHLERKFMHLGFHIYDVGFRAPTWKPPRLVFATTALLIVMVGRST
jgi:phosphate transport system permease protein